MKRFLAFVYDKLFDIPGKKCSSSYWWVL